MSFLAVLLALLLEQARPLSRDNLVHTGFRTWVAWVRHSLDAGRNVHGALVWGVAVGVPTGVAVVVHWLLWSYSLILTFAWAVLVLYLTLGFRQFSHHFTRIRTALEQGDDAAAQAELSLWQPQGMVGSGDRSMLLSQVMSQSVLAVHRHVLGVLVAFVVSWWMGLGPAGAVLFRLSDHLARGFIRPAKSVNVPELGLLEDRSVASDWAQKAWHGVNWLPSRCTAMAFAVVGNFEEAVAVWRSNRAVVDDSNLDVVLAAASGALNVQIARDAVSPEGSDLRPPEVAHLTSLVGLVWRSVVLWMLLLALLTLANVLG